MEERTPKIAKEYLEHYKKVNYGMMPEWVWDMAIKALEQESKTVLYSGDGYADGYMVYDIAECPSCGYEYEDGDKDWGLPFCPNCGQSLSWESEEV